MRIEDFIGKVYHGDARRLLQVLPTASIDAVITDAMYGTAKHYRYKWGFDPAHGDPVKHWLYHESIYQQCRRVLKPGGVLAWGQGCKFAQYFRGWFGDHRVWTLTRFAAASVLAVGNVWIVQTREQQPIEFPHQDSLVMCDRAAYLPLRKLHPCPKPVEELDFVISALTKPGQLVHIG